MTAAIAAVIPRLCSAGRAWSDVVTISVPPLGLVSSAGLPGRGHHSFPHRNGQHRTKFSTLRRSPVSGDWCNVTKIELSDQLIAGTEGRGTTLRALTLIHPSDTFLRMQKGLALDLAASLPRHD
jgi:hypothetical protein